MAECSSCPTGETGFRDPVKGKTVEKLAACNYSTTKGCRPEDDCAKCEFLTKVRIIDLKESGQA